MYITTALDKGFHSEFSAGVSFHNVIIDFLGNRFIFCVLFHFFSGIDTKFFNIHRFDITQRIFQCSARRHGIYK